MFEEKKYIVHTLHDLADAAKWLTDNLASHYLLAMKGEMGAGKTTLIQAVCRYLGVDQDVTSPTFSLVNEYISGSGEIIYHFDFYRIEDPVEALDFGLDEYLYSGLLCLMEWPEKVIDYLPDDTVWLSITVKDDQSRELCLKIPS